MLLSVTERLGRSRAFKNIIIKDIYSTNSFIDKIEDNFIGLNIYLHL